MEVGYVNKRCSDFGIKTPLKKDVFEKIGK